MQNNPFFESGLSNWAFNLNNSDFHKIFENAIWFDKVNLNLESLLAQKKLFWKKKQEPFMKNGWEMGGNFSHKKYDM